MLKIKQIAFTLIELLVVIAIIGILSGMIVVSMGGVTNKATIAKAQVFSNSLRNSLLINIIGEWKIDELTTATEGTIIQDSWGGNNNGILDTYVSTVDAVNKIKTGTDCISGNCLSFDGIDDYVYVSGSDAASSPLAITGAITLSSWVKFSNSGVTGAIIARGINLAATGDFGYVLARYSANNLIYWYIHNATNTSGTTSTTAITDTNWHFITATWNGTTNTNGIKIYIDGIVDKQGTSAVTAIGQPAYQLRIGKTSDGNFPLNGLIDDARVYNAAIPISQIQEQYYIGLNKLFNNGGISKEEYQNRIEELIVAQK
ncbi:MAG: LamG-like jellyroll fold domain-containing protein [Candidatus Pacearchaeota archaeon]